MRGDIVRDSADTKNATYYQARVANVGKRPTDGDYWLRLDENNYSKYGRLIKGAGEWNAAEAYAKTFGIEVGNKPSPPETGVFFSLRKKDERGSLLTGAGFNAYYADDGSLCRALNANPDKKGVYATDLDDKGDTLEHSEISVDDDQPHLTLNADGTKTLKLIVREDRVPDNYGKIKDFRVDAHVVYNAIEAKWKVKNLTVTFSDGKTVTIENGGTIDAEELIDESYRLNISITKQSKKQNYSVADLEGAEYTIYGDSTLSLPVTTIIIGRNGKGTAENLPLKDYWIKETKAPKSGKFLFSDEVKQIRAEDIATGTGVTTSNATVTFEEDEDSARLNVHRWTTGK
ncbi:MAG: prealbumin-like fold domain-containing protein [Eubacterium sp.]